MNNAEEWINDMEDRIMEITTSEQQTEKSNEKNESKIRDLWENIKCANLHTIGIQEGKESKKQIENVFEEMMADNFSNSTDIQVQEAEKVNILE